MNLDILKNRILALKSGQKLTAPEQEYLSRLEFAMKGDIVLKTESEYSKYRGDFWYISQTSPPPPPKKKNKKNKLRKCQKFCIQKMQENYSKKIQKSYYKLACGSGKSLTIINFIKLYPELRHVILVPSLLLMHQFANILEENFPNQWTSCGTGQNYVESMNICICVYNSISKIGSYDMMYIDEAHHIYVPEIYKENNIKEGDISYIKQIQNYDAFKFYFSATIDDYHYQFSFSDAISKGYLTNFNLEFFETNVLDEHDLYKIIYNNPQYQHIIVYCNNIKKCKKLSEYLMGKEIPSDIISAEINQSSRFKILDKFRKNELRVIFTVQCLSEGIDITCADTCIFYDKRNSTTNVIQCIGRVLRYDPSKFIGHVVIIVTPDNYDKLLKTLLKILSTQFDLSELKNINPNSYSLESDRYVDRKFAFDQLLISYQKYNMNNMLVKSQLKMEYDNLLEKLPETFTSEFQNMQIINISKNIKFFDSGDQIEVEFHKKIFEENETKERIEHLTLLTRKEITIEEIEKISKKYNIHIKLYDGNGIQIGEYGQDNPLYQFIYSNSLLYLVAHKENSSICKECKKLICIPNIEICKSCQKKDNTFIWDKLICQYTKVKSICNICSKLIKHPDAQQCKKCQLNLLSNTSNLYVWNKERYIYIQKYNECSECKKLIEIKHTKCFDCMDSNKVKLESSKGGYEEYSFTTITGEEYIYDINQNLLKVVIEKKGFINLIKLTFNINNDVEFINHLLQKYFPGTAKIKNIFVIKQYAGIPSIETIKKIKVGMIHLLLKPMVSKSKDGKTYLHFKLIKIIE